MAEGREFRMASEMEACPGTVSEVVEIMLSEMSFEEMEKLRNMEKEALIELHFTLGMGIRNRFVYKNRELLESCAGELHPGVPEDHRHSFVHSDDVSGVIIEALWRRARSEGSPV